MLGAITGDIIGSRYEFNNYRAKDFQPLFHPRASITDDTVCTVALADALLRRADPTLALREWCLNYWHIGGWGMRFEDWIESGSTVPYNSFGNGAAMRVSSAGLLATSRQEALDLAQKITEITHNHPEGIKGGQSTAMAIWLARQGEAPSDICKEIQREFGYNMERSVDDIRPTYKYDETSQNTVPEALICALEANDFEDAMRNAISIGGDSDTIAAIAGGVAEARFGLPVGILDETLSVLDKKMQELIFKLYKKCSKHDLGATKIYRLLIA